MIASVLRPLDSGYDAANSESPTHYMNAREHIADLTERLDLQIRREILRCAEDEQAEQLSYVAVTGRELDALLNRGGSDQHGCATSAAVRSIDDDLASLERRIGARVAATLARGTRLPWIEIVSWFGLSETEANVLFACFASSLDPKYERVYGYLHKDVNRREPTIGRLLAIGGSNSAQRAEARTIFGAGGTLMCTSLLHITDDDPERVPFCQQTVCIDQRIAAFLDGDCEFDARMSDCMDWASTAAPEPTDAVDTSIVERMLSAIGTYCDSTTWTAAPTFYLHGPPSASKILLAQSICRTLGVPLLHVNAEQLAALPIGFAPAIALALREAFLQHAALYVDKLEPTLEQDSAGVRLRALVQSLDQYHGAPTFLVGELPWRWAQAPERSPWLPVQLKQPAYVDQVATWKVALAGNVDFTEQQVSILASIHPLALPRATAAVRIAAATATLGGGNRASLSDVARACRDLSRPNFGQLASKIEADLVWDELVLPAPALEQLRDICVQAKYRCHVYGTWGFDHKLQLGKGLNVLFAGPSGTGKTMSAQIIANDLGVDLYKIDLSQAVSKYIGETEKNLRQIFATAQAANAILFFDEADALLGKRSEVKDAHDRYANLEVAYLLQKMEEHAGITILATNLRRNIDEAFARRIRFIVEFPFPSEADRQRIWEGIWPRELPLSDDIDFGRLARQFKLSGGNIRNIAVCAAFLAAEPNEPVAMRHLSVAIKRELQKMGRLLDYQTYEGPGKP